MTGAVPHDLELQRLGPRVPRRYLRVRQEDCEPLKIAGSFAGNSGRGCKCQARKRFRTWDMVAASDPDEKASVIQNDADRIAAAAPESLRCPLIAVPR